MECVTYVAGIDTPNKLLEGHFPKINRIAVAFIGLDPPVLTTRCPQPFFVIAKLSTHQKSITMYGTSLQRPLTASSWY